MIRKTFRLLLFLALVFTGFTTQAQEDGPITMGLDVDFKNPQEYTLGPIRVEGADNYDHNAVRLIAGLRQGSQITVPGEKITKAVKNLWEEGIFSDVEIYAEKEVAGVLYLVIKLAPRPNYHDSDSQGFHVVK